MDAPQNSREEDLFIILKLLFTLSSFFTGISLLPHQFTQRHLWILSPRKVIIGGDNGEWQNVGGLGEQQLTGAH
jgi:hypothetical protein